MRLKKVFISKYKNLIDFSLDFTSDSFIDIFVGKNGSGKSNFLEALIEIFHHLYEHGRDQNIEIFNYSITFEIDGETIIIDWQDGRFSLNQSGRSQKTFSTVPLPENILIYYSGHNENVSNLVHYYEESFRSRIRGANSAESPRFIGIGSDYKTLLLCTFLLQPVANRAKQYICSSLNIKNVSLTIKLHLSRPKFATARLQELGFKAIEPFDTRSHFWGADGITHHFLRELIGCISGEFNHTNIYNSTLDTYIIPVNADIYQRKFADVEVSDQFRMLDNLKILGMLAKVEADLTLNNDKTAVLDSFSDGQFQSVYIYAIAELFKDRHCITLLDEPDSFLHPEWQFKFLQQIFDLTDAATKKNHILMSSHSASTIATADERMINLFDFENDSVVVNRVRKSDVISSLSAGLISFTEGEARLNIHHVLRNTRGPVLFTEGITDEMILEVAWRKLYDNTQRPFEIQNAFDRIFLRNLFSRDDFRDNFPDRKMFALFDFDEAFNDWKGLKEEKHEIEDPTRGLSKQLKHLNHYAMLLPVPNNLIKQQVLDAEGNPWAKGAGPHLTLELLFFKEEMNEWFSKKAMPGGGEIIEFVGDKVSFATNYIPSLRIDDFEIFKYIFDFIESKIK